MLLIGATIWTVIIKKAQSINDLMVGPEGAPVPLGVEVSIGNALLLAWGAFACLIISIIPYMIRCVYRFLLFPVTLYPTRLHHADHVILHLAQLLYVSRMRLRWWLAIKTKHPFISSLLCMTLFVFFTYR